MSERARRQASYEDLLALGENVIGEIIGGVLYTQPRPAGPHTMVASALGADLGAPFGRGRGGPGGWYIVAEPELHFGNEVVVPDLAGWRVERLPAAARRQAYFSVAPDWVAEIASAETAQRDLELKVPLYAAQGVPNLWLVEPLAANVEAYELREQGWSSLGTWTDERDARIVPFEAVALDLVSVWEWTGLRG